MTQTLKNIKNQLKEPVQVIPKLIANKSTGVTDLSVTINAEDSGLHNGVFGFILFISGITLDDHNSYNESQDNKISVIQNRNKSYYNDPNANTTESDSWSTITPASYKLQSGKYIKGLSIVWVNNVPNLKYYYHKSSDMETLSNTIFPRIFNFVIPGIRQFATDVDDKGVYIKEVCVKNSEVSVATGKSNKPVLLESVGQCTK